MCLSKQTPQGLLTQIIEITLSNGDWQLSQSMESVRKVQPQNPDGKMGGPFFKKENIQVEASRLEELQETH